ncbi:hypothetical protein [Sphingomonas sp. LHG3406-1]|uniref:hypothetical protein n=1 Tax=Sphingomonas sp. LHG3406-1 TaxID=2804617 RepID=UPI0026378BFA|nr:hypothetical protein [Sphingomonas sp. LHG3406-1]
MFAVIIAAALAVSPESLVRPPLDGFIVGNEQSAGPMSLKEEVPAGETVQQWTRMVTTQRLGGLAGRLSASDFLERLAAMATGSCPGATAGTVTETGGAATVRLDCPRNPTTGLPETFIAKAMMGASDLYIVQIAWRRVPTSQDIGWSETYLGKVSLKPAN